MVKMHVKGSADLAILGSRVQWLLSRSSWNLILCLLPFGLEGAGTAPAAQFTWQLLCASSESCELPNGQRVLG